MTDNTKSIFVGGPIQHVISSNGFDRNLKSIISQVISIYSNQGWNVYSAHLAEEFGIKTESLSPKYIATRDFIWMNDADLFLGIILSDAENKIIRTDGTHVELGWASAMRKPTLLLCDDNSILELSLLVQGLSEITSFKIIRYQDFEKNPSILLKFTNKFQQISRKIYANKISI